MDKDGFLTTLNGNKILGIVPNISEKVGSEYSNHILASSSEDKDNVATVNVASTNYKDTAIESGISGNNLKSAESNIQDIKKLEIAYRAAYNNDANYPLDEITIDTGETIIDFGQVPQENGYLSVDVNGITYSQPFKDSSENTLKLFSDKLSKIVAMNSKVDTETGTITLASVIPNEKFSIKNGSNTHHDVKFPLPIPKKGSTSELKDNLYTLLENKIKEMGGDLVTNTNTIDKKDENFGYMQLDLKNLNITDNHFGNLISDGGNLYVQQDDGKYLVGRLAVSQFINTEGLTPIGAGLYKDNAEISGGPKNIIDTKIVNMSVESSNADISDILLKLMSLQRSYEASSKSISTSDEFMKTAINLVR
jgi:flagellar hook protein FlgE